MKLVLVSHCNEIRFKNQVLQTVFAMNLVLVLLCTCWCRSNSDNGDNGVVCIPLPVAYLGMFFRGGMDIFSTIFSYFQKLHPKYGSLAWEILTSGGNLSSVPHIPAVKTPLTTGTACNSGARLTLWIGNRRQRRGAKTEKSYLTRPNVGIR